MSIDLQKLNSTILAQHIISLNHEFLHSSLMEVSIMHHQLILVSLFISFPRGMHFCSVCTDVRRQVCIVLQLFLFQSVRLRCSKKLCHESLLQAIFQCLNKQPPA